jgi:hypothetical protein
VDQADENQFDTWCHLPADIETTKIELKYWTLREWNLKKKKIKLKKKHKKWNNKIYRCSLFLFCFWVQKLFSRTRELKINNKEYHDAITDYRDYWQVKQRFQNTVYG